jgi:hypothetical protein
LDLLSKNEQGLSQGDVEAKLNIGKGGGYIPLRKIIEQGLVKKVGTLYCGK